MGNGCLLAETFECLLLFSGNEFFLHRLDNAARKLGIFGCFGKDILEDFEKGVLAGSGCYLVHVFSRAESVA